MDIRVKSVMDEEQYPGSSVVQGYLLSEMPKQGM
jgi:hypothetical protein